MFNNQLLASKLLETGAICIQPDQPFTRASGLRSPIYFNNRVVLSNPEIRSGIIDLMVKVVKDFEFFNVIHWIPMHGLRGIYLLQTYPN
ncbi:MAG TPA: hypothetical protein VFV79_04130 [Saprospiraceae bacterium]|nr:hypothetical protein [Saprospiraceae bacterium]